MELESEGRGPDALDSEFTREVLEIEENLNRDLNSLSLLLEAGQGVASKQ